MSAPTDVQSMLGESVDLTTLDTSTPRPWTPGASRILRPGLRAMWFAPRGSLKSFVALLLCAQIIEAGGRALYIDLENGARRQAERLATIIADRDASAAAAIAERLDYRPHARLRRFSTPDLRKAWADSFAGLDLAIIDSTARALGQLGLAEDSNADFGRFMVEHIDPIAEQGAAVLLLDNCGWSEQERSRGASNKWDLVELVYKVRADPKITPDHHGIVQLECVRSRDGDEAATLEVGAGGGSYGRLASAPPGEQAHEQEQALLQYVAEHPGADTEEIAKGIKKRSASVRPRLAALAVAGTVTQCPSETRDRRGVPHFRNGWYLASASQLAAVPQPRTDTDGHYSAAISRPPVPALKGGAGTGAASGTVESNGHDGLPDGWTLDEIEALPAEFDDDHGTSL